MIDALWLPNWSEEPLTRAKCIAEIKGHAGVSWDQPRVKLLRNAL